MITFNSNSLRYTQHFIDGKWESSVLGNAFKNINPSDESVIGHVAEGSAVEISLAARAAYLCFHNVWSRLHSRERTTILFRIGELISEQIDWLANVESMESGKPIRETRIDIENAANIFRRVQEIKITTSGNSSFSGGSYNILNILPYGVVGIINDYLSSFLSAAVKVAAALNVGNTVVLKPSEYTPCSVLELAKVCQSAGLPDGAFNVVSGKRSCESALYTHPLIDKVILPECSLPGIGDLTKKQFCIEWHETIANIVLPDGNPELAANAVLQCLLDNQGNVGKCRNITFVAQEIAGDFTGLLTEKIKNLKIGNSRSPDTDVGPLVNGEQVDALHASVERILKNGGNLILGGHPLRERSVKGFYYVPTIIANSQNCYISSSNVVGPYMEVNWFQNFKQLFTILRNMGRIKGISLWTDDNSLINDIKRYINPNFIWLNKYPYIGPSLIYDNFKEHVWKQSIIFLNLLNGRL